MINSLKGDDKSYNEIKVETSVNTILGTTIENLQSAIAGENYEYTDLYPEFAKVAEEENLPEISARIRAIIQAEENHEDRYKKFLNNIEKGTVFKKDEDVVWVCRNCGYAHKGKEAMKECPSCGHPQAFFEVKK